ncbi:MAG: chemotaxis protein CheA, partial [Planctomycetes bacterium]|nr:chemotaxis protein CheA [Planctomycetota bacterium]
SGKKITLRVEGEDTELDRNVVDQIGDPLVHMIRNSCDHGLEPPEERLAAGKPETGVLTLRAYHQGGSIVIEIEDDGRGLPRDKILKKAIERGIYTPDRELDKIPDSEVYNLVFLPGFSTAEKVTDISGRGVGMDVVRRNIQALRGKTEIRSAPGKGSTFAMRLPLTMAIIDGMIVRLGSQRYVIPTLSIEQSFQPTRDQISSVIGQGEVVSVRGSLLPIYRLSQIVNLDEGIDDPCESLLIVLESNDLRCCLLVDEIIGQQQVVIKSLGEGVKSIRGVSGGAILGDGRVALILDVGGLIKEATSTKTMRIAA